MFKIKNLFLILVVAIFAAACCKEIPTGPSIDPGGVVEFKYHRVRAIINPKFPADLTGKEIFIWNDEFGARGAGFVFLDENTWTAETMLAGSSQRYYVAVEDYAVSPVDNPGTVAVEISARVEGNSNTQWILLDIIEPNRKMNGEWASFRFQNGVLYPSSN